MRIWGREYIPLDHDQRNTLNTGFTANLPMHTWFATNVYYGSGFSNGLACGDPLPAQKRAILRAVSAGAHDVRFVGGPRVRRATGSCR